jgi:tRNA(fMet)-specific endonuclease VapC
MKDSLIMLDTNICIYLINQKPPQVLAKFSTLPAGSVAISSITGAELSFGVAKSGSKRNVLALEKFLISLQILPFDQAAMQTYGSLRAGLERKGTPIGPMDLLIAAHALALDVCLVTNNTKEFARVPKLRLENWV